MFNFHVTLFTHVKKTNYGMKCEIADVWLAPCEDADNAVPKGIQYQVYSHSLADMMPSYKMDSLVLHNLGDYKIESVGVSYVL